MSLFADHRISLPIPYAAAQIDDFRTFLNGDPVLDLATPLDAAIALASLLLRSQVGVKVATTALISIDIMVNPLGADASLSSLVQVAIDLLWAPVLTDHFFNHSPFPSKIRVWEIWACFGRYPRRPLLR